MRVNYIKSPGKYLVWIKEDGRWTPNGEGELTKKQADRIAAETIRFTGVRAKVLPVGIDA